MKLGYHSLHILIFVSLLIAFNACNTCGNPSIFPFQLRPASRIYFYSLNNYQILYLNFFGISHISSRDLFVSSHLLNTNFLVLFFGQSHGHLPMARNSFLFQIFFLASYVDLHIEPSEVKLLNSLLLNFLHMIPHPWSIYFWHFSFLVDILLKLPTPYLVHVFDNM